MPDKSQADFILTPRLELVPFSLPLLLATRDGRIESVETALKAAAPAGWPPREVLEAQLPRQIEQLQADASLLPWLGRLMILREARMLAGGINVKGPPDAAGTCEIGYQVEPAFRGRGYASEASRALVDWLFQQRGVRRVRAKTRPDNEASLRVLRKLGMRIIGTELTEGQGEMSILEATLADFLPADDG